MKISIETVKKNINNLYFHDVEVLLAYCNSESTHADADELRQIAELRLVLRERLVALQSVHNDISKWVSKDE